MTAATQPQGAHLVGSINLPDTESVLRTAAGALGDRLRRIPDGETGERWHWIAFQPNRLAPTPGLERVGDDPILLPGGLDMRPLRIADGVDPASLVLPALGYAEAALASWATFRALQESGEIPETTRFQVSLPTPAAVVGAFVVPESRAAFEPVYEAALLAELDEILAAIPHQRLAIQWDNAVEFGLIEAADREGGLGGFDFGAWFGDVWDGVLERTARLAARIPVDVELGYHLCYGDVAERHFVEPADTTNLARFTAGVLASVDRPVQWIHLPVPIERDDDAYFAPLEGLELPAGTELYLGLVHREDGVEGARRRIATALRHVPAFGVGTECGIGRSPRESLPALLETHREVAAAWA